MAREDTLAANGTHPVTATFADESYGSPIYTTGHARVARGRGDGVVAEGVAEGVVVLCL